LLFEEFLKSFSRSQQAVPQPSHEEIRQGMEMTVSAVSLDDLTQILSMGKATAPPQVLQLWPATAERNLSPEVLAKLNARIEATS
jgi:hypothetical protein